MPPPKPNRTKRALFLSECGSNSEGSGGNSLDSWISPAVPDRRTTAQVTYVYPSSEMAIRKVSDSSCVCKCVCVSVCVCLCLWILYVCVCEWEGVREREWERGSEREGVRDIRSSMVCACVSVCVCARKEWESEWVSEWVSEKKSSRVCECVSEWEKEFKSEWVSEREDVYVWVCERKGVNTELVLS